MIAPIRLLLSGTLLVAAVLPPVTAASAKDAGQIVILVGLDGLRWDYLEKFHPPHLTTLASRGVRAERMIPSFPSLTFPNFYTLVTGLHPEHHGLISNTFYDPGFEAAFALGSATVTEGRWWGGEPVWATAQKQGLPAACMFWPGSEAEISGVRPSIWKTFAKDFPPEARVQTVLAWLALPADQRPRLITVYFHEVDTAGHRYGIDSPENAEAVKIVDTAVGQLADGIRKLGLESVVNLVIVADHGMAAVSPDRVIALSDLVDPRTTHVDFAGAVAGLRPLTGTADDLLETLKSKRSHFEVYRREEIPERLHFRQNPRIPPIVVIADEGWSLIKRPLPNDAARKDFVKASHGFDPELPSMGATFIAFGPAFKSGVTIPPFENIQVYNLLCAVLDLTPAPNDGDDRLQKQVLK
jgi:predicted AlkP superfamily pyrophosphatase or phosphodiesterase